MLNIKPVELAAAAVTVAAISFELESTSARRRIERKEGTGVRRGRLIIKISEHILISASTRGGANWVKNRCN